jgi:hypothetical protein
MGEYAGRGRKIVLAVQTTHYAQTLQRRGVYDISCKSPRIRNMRKMAP